MVAQGDLCLEGPHTSFKYLAVAILQFLIILSKGSCFSFSTGPCILYGPTNEVGIGRGREQYRLQIVPKWRRCEVEGMTNCPKVGGMLIIVTFI